MAISGKIKQETVGTETKDVFVAEFTNGNIEQLEELSGFLKTRGFSIPESKEDRLMEVLRISVAWLESVKQSSQADSPEQK